MKKQTKHEMIQLTDYHIVDNWSRSAISCQLVCYVIREESKVEGWSSPRKINEESISSIYSYIWTDI